MQRYAIAAGILTGLVLWTTPAGAAEDKTLAKTHFQNGKDLWNAGNFEAAAAEFELSIQYYKNKNNLYELAYCYVKLKRDADAYRTFKESRALLRAHIEEKGEKRPNDAKMAQDIDEQMKALEGRLGRLTVSTTPEGATVKIDQQGALTTPLDDPIVLEPGAHRVEVSLDGYETDIRQVTMTAGSEQSVALILKTVQAPVAPAVAPDKPDVEQVQPQEPAPLSASPASTDDSLPVDSQPGWQKPLFIGSLAGTVAMTGVAAAMWTIRGRKINDYNTTVDDLDKNWDPELADQAKDIRSSAKTFHAAAVATTIVTGVFGAVLATSVVLMKNGKEQQRQVSVAPTLGGMSVIFRY